MNWKQLHTLSTPAERAETVALILQTIEARQSRLILVRGRLLRERRRRQIAHFIGERRRSSALARAVAVFNFLAILLILTITTALFVLFAPPQLAVNAMLLHLVFLTAALLQKST